jgi:hypothetical protein
MVWWLVWILVIVVALIFLGGFLWWGFKKSLALALNSIIGFFALYAVQAFFRPELLINIWSVLLTALLGIFGFLIVLILHFTGIAF